LNESHYSPPISTSIHPPLIPPPEVVIEVYTLYFEGRLYTRSCFIGLLRGRGRVGEKGGEGWGDGRRRGAILGNWEGWGRWYNNKQYCTFEDY